MEFDCLWCIVEKRKDLKLLEEQAREPHEAAFEAAKAELEEQQLRLQDVINDMNSRVEYVNRADLSSQKLVQATKMTNKFLLCYFCLQRVHEEPKGAYPRTSRARI